ncbi:hypothetical protein KP509_14G082200 [Ceratopteris richardii]|uniref:RING-type E3 ubiquitin transferase n=1 Tax=Ceratopteris richardii TaxID=49495 RepID=A0A8T2TDP9_CERRI|nr:hypothetical protein KP509_14G082200 [Ceratopteris richardii]
MGACFSCLSRIFSSDRSRRASSVGSLRCSRWRRCCRCLATCCGMSEAHFEETDVLDAMSGPLLHSNQGSHTIVSSAVSNTINTGSTGSSARQEKMGRNISQTQFPESQDQSGGTSSRHGVALNIEQSNLRGQDRDPKVNELKVLPLGNNGKSEDITSFQEDDDDICSICLDEYDFQDPKMLIECGHDFHLACILEWMERSNHCPICYKEVDFEELS